MEETPLRVNTKLEKQILADPRSVKQSLGQESDDICQYDTQQAPHDFFGKILRASEPVQIMDDVESQDIRSSQYTVLDRYQQD